MFESRQGLRRPGLGAAIAFVACLATGVATAQEVTLKSSDGTVDIVGDFVDFEDNTYVIRTGLGELRISAARVRCEGEACPEITTADADVTFTGSDTVGLGMMPLLLEGYAGFLDAAATITATGNAGELLAEFVGEQGFGDPLGSYLVTSTVSGDAFAALLEGETDIGMSSRRIRPEEARALRDAGAGNMIDPSQEHIVALDSLVVIVHPNNPIESLTTDQLADIFSGVITDWSDLGLEAAPIQVIGRPEESGTQAVFNSFIFDDAQVPLAPDALILNDNVAMAAAVNDNPAAIGFVPYAFQRGAKPLPLVNECGLTMVPTTFAARTEEYALERRLYMYNREDSANEGVQAFLDYIRSPEADGVIAKSGFIDLGIARQSQPIESARGQMLLTTEADPYEGGIMREMLGLMVDYERLSTTFRFRTGSSQLDERGVEDLSRLSAFLEGQPEGTQVLFVGFTDEVGAFDSNRELSRTRAQSVLDQIRTATGDSLAGLEMAAAGFGEIAPSACNSDEVGRRINRRVEVWLTAPENG
ncbi:MAG: phosphate ABC transporter substrate-binding/OmpA family protein [Pseudomonadota bacterium]